MESSVVFFPCDDLEKTRAFYLQVVGMRLYRDFGNCILLDSGHGYLGFVAYGDGRPNGTGACISFNCSSQAEVDREYERLMARIPDRIKGPPQKQGGFPVYSFFFEDPNGYQLEFQKIQAEPLEQAGKNGTASF